MRDEIEVLLTRRAEFLKEKILKLDCKVGGKGLFCIPWQYVSRRESETALCVLETFLLLRQ